MLFDTTLMFYHVGNTFAFTTGEVVNLAGWTGGSAGTTGAVINLGNARDLGIGVGEAVPKIAVIVSSGITAACASLTINAQFQGSTDSINWTTYIKSGANSTASYLAGAKILPYAVPRRPAGVSLPLYYRVTLVLGGLSTAAVSTGSIIGGIVLDLAEGGDDTLYGAGYTVS